MWGCAGSPARLSLGDIHALYVQVEPASKSGCSPTHASCHPSSTSASSYRCLSRTLTCGASFASLTSTAPSTTSFYVPSSTRAICCESDRGDCRISRSMETSLNTTSSTFSIKSHNRFAKYRFEIKISQLSHMRSTWTLRNRRDFTVVHHRPGDPNIVALTKSMRSIHYASTLQFS